MALVSLNLKPTDKQLRDFGLIGLCMCTVVVVLLLMLGKIGPIGTGIIAGISVVLFILSRISTACIKPVYLVLIVVTFPIGWVLSHVLVAVFYYGIVTPVALVFKLIGRDPLHRAMDKDASTYWIPYDKERKPEDYFHQF